MEINITPLLEEDMFPFSHSAAEGGPNAGPNSWRAALAGPRPLLNSPEEFEAFRDHVRSFGAWDDEEIAAWSDNECQALFLQLIAGDCRQCPRKLEPGEERSRSRPQRADSLDEIDWAAYESEASAGRIPSNLFRSDSGEIFYQLSN